MQDRFFPLFVDITGKNVLIVGAGKIAYRKAKTLLEYGASITVVTREVAEPKFLELKDVHIEKRDFDEHDIKDKFLVVAATDDAEFNNYIYNLCKMSNTLVNNITSKVDMNCRFVSTVETEEYQIGISAKGNPVKSKALKDKIVKFLQNLKNN